MATCLVTGVAGFIGSHVAEALLARGDKVVGVDKLADNYDPRRKKANLAELPGRSCFTFLSDDLGSLDVAGLLEREGVDLVFHEAALAGVRASWGAEFPHYLADNVLVTQRLLEACRSVPVRRFIFASSSSVYGDAGGCLAESHLAQPHSPYGVTKLAAENLCLAYHRNFGVPIVALRYFTVYGPRQRPDMAIYRLLDAVRGELSFPIYGDGGQQRDFTFVADVVRANLLAAEAPEERVAGEVFNIGGGRSWGLIDVVREAEVVAGRNVCLRYEPAQPGDVASTWADIARADAILGWRPKVQLLEGLERQFRWQAGE